jgi:hypothetical protein
MFTLGGSVISFPASSEWTQITMPSYVNSVAGRQYLCLQNDCIDGTGCNAGPQYSWDDVRIEILAAPEGLELCASSTPV